MHHTFPEQQLQQVLQGKNSYDHACFTCPTVCYITVYIPPIGDSSVRDPGGASCQKLCSGPGRHEPSLLRAHYWHHVLLCRGGPQHPPSSAPQQLTDSAPDPSLTEPGRSQQRRGSGGGQGVGQRHPPSPHACQLSGCAAGCRKHNS